MNSALRLVGVELELLNLARQRVAAPAQPLRSFHAMSPGVLQGAQDQRLFEFLFEPLADGALATCQRLREFAIERLLPVAAVLGRSAAIRVWR